MRLLAIKNVSLDDLRLVQNQEFLRELNVGPVTVNELRELIDDPDHRVASPTRKKYATVQLNDLKNAAYAAAQWASGLSQKEIAVSFGYGGAAPVCSAILRFLEVYLPDRIKER